MIQPRRLAVVRPRTSRTSSPSRTTKLTRVAASIESRFSSGCYFLYCYYYLLGLVQRGRPLTTTGNTAGESAGQPRPDTGPPGSVHPLAPLPTLSSLRSVPAGLPPSPRFFLFLSPSFFSLLSSFFCLFLYSFLLFFFSPFVRRGMWAWVGGQARNFRFPPLRWPGLIPRAARPLFGGPSSRGARHSKTTALCAAARCSRAVRKASRSLAAPADAPPPLCHKKKKKENKKAAASVVHDNLRTARRRSSSSASRISALGGSDQDQTVRCRHGRGRLSFRSPRSRVQLAGSRPA